MQTTGDYGNLKGFCCSIVQLSVTNFTVAAAGHLQKPITVSWGIQMLFLIVVARWLFLGLCYLGNTLTLLVSLTLV